MPSLDLSGLKKSSSEEAPKKRRRRRKAHRLSNSERAKKAREKKKQYYNELEDKVAYLTNLCESLHKENLKFKKRINQLEAHNQPIEGSYKKRDSKDFEKLQENIGEE